MTVNPPPNTEIEEPEIVDYDTKDITKGVRVSLKDGSVLEVTLEVNSVTKIGHNTTTGEPVYVVASQTIIKTKSIPKELYKKPKGKPVSGYQ